MGKIAFVSKRGRSNLAVQVAVSASLGYDLNMLITHCDPFLRAEKVLTPNQTGLFSPQSALISKAIDGGMHELARLHVSRKLTPESVKDNSKRVVKGHLDLLTNLPHEVDGESFRSSIQMASKIYDTVFIDMQEAYDRETALICDVVVVALNQDMQTLEMFFKEEDDGIPKILVLEDMDEYSAYTAKRIAKYFKYTDKIYTVPYCSGFLDAVNAREVENFMRRAANAKKDDVKSVFVNSVNRLTKDLLQGVGINTEIKRKIK